MGRKDLGGFPRFSNADENLALLGDFLLQEKKMISVIIPTCDRPYEFLREAIESVQSQSLMPTEVIVVDNGINDVECGALPEGVIFYRLPPRVGASRARNFGAAMATGTHLAFLDDDDWWDVDFLLEAWKVLQAEGTRCVYGRKDVYRNGQVERYKCPSAETLTISFLLRKNPGTGGQNLLIEKIFFWQVGGFNEYLRVSNDKAFAIDVLLTGEKVSIAHNAVAVLRPHEGSRLRNEKKHRLKFIWKYRNLYGKPAAVRKAFLVIAGIALDKFRQLLHRVK